MDGNMESRILSPDSGNTKRPWDQFNDFVDDSRLAEDGRKRHAEWTSAAAWNTTFDVSYPLSSMDWCGTIESPVVMDASEKNYSQNSTSYRSSPNRSSPRFTYDGQSGSSSDLSPFISTLLEVPSCQMASQQTSQHHQLPFPSDTIISPPESAENDLQFLSSLASPLPISEHSVVPLTPCDSHIPLGSTWSSQHMEGQESHAQHTLSATVPTQGDAIGDSSDNRLPYNAGNSPLQIGSLHASCVSSPLDLMLNDPEISECMGHEESSNDPTKISSPSEAVFKSTKQPYDTCFGMIILKAFCSTRPAEATGRIPVTIRVCGDFLKLCFEASNKYAGIVESPTLSRLSKRFTVRLAGMMTELGKQTGRTMTSKSKEVAIEVVIYGLREDAYNVGNLLSEDDLYLQHPNECDARMTYINPQYLVRPGCEMSELHGVSFALASKSSSGNDILDEKRTIQLLQVFNYANGPTKFSKVLESPRLRTHLQDHQMKALAMMAEKEQGVLEGSQFGTLWDVSIDANGQNCYRHVITGSSQSTPPNPIYGGLLADEMGLGKTLSVLALITWSLDTLSINASSAEAALPRGTLIVAPKSTIPGWQQQIQRHIVSGGVRVALYYGSNRSRLSEELNTYDIILTNYDTLRSEWIGKGRDAPLCSQEWARLVLDEAHHIRNRSSKTFEAACAIPARHRWCLTGTPIHNRLDDYGALMTFLGVPPFSSKSLFDYWLTIPMNKNHSDGLRRLKKLVMATCLRRTKETVKEKLKLPQRIEREERINLNNHERELYDFFKARTFALVTGMLCELHGSSEQQKQGNILGLINCLRRICNHSEQLLPTAALNAWRSRNTSGVDWSFAQSSTSTCNFCNAELDNSERLDSPWSELSCLHVICSNCTITRIEDSELPANDPCPVCNTESTMLLCQKHPIHSSEEIALRYQPSTKVNALLENLYRERKLNSSNITGNPIKSVIFSQWTKMLDLIEIALRANGFIFQRIDGQKSLDQRIRALDVFNNNLACTVMLASIGSVAEGVDLQVANHVHLVEPHWNPMVEAQAVDRIHRMGQSRDVVTIRYIANNTIEKYVQDVQAYKLSLIHQSLGELESVQYEADEAKWKSLMAALE